jgi:hypothetical protein
VCLYIVVAVDAAQSANVVGGALQAARATSTASTPVALEPAGNSAALFASKSLEMQPGLLLLPAAGTVVALQATNTIVKVLTGQRNKALHGHGR